MATPVVQNHFRTNVLQGEHDFDNDTFKIALSNAAIDANADLSDVTQIAAGNGYVSGGTTLTVTLSTVSTNQAQVAVSDFTLTATGGSIPTFRYGLIYNDTNAGKLGCFSIDFGSGQTLASGESRTFDFDTYLYLSKANT